MDLVQGAQVERSRIGAGSFSVSPSSVTALFFKGSLRKGQELPKDNFLLGEGRDGKGTLGEAKGGGLAKRGGGGYWGRRWYQHWLEWPYHCAHIEVLSCW